jgi:XTP/dITP diphosphohydrolase
MKILLASHNAKKIQEIQEIFDLPGVEWVSAAAFPDVPEVVEDLLTFEGNATKKARELALATGLWTLADDSGLEVEALHHAPGVFSARYAGEPCNHANNNAKLLRELAGQTNRAARFRCVARGNCIRLLPGTHYRRAARHEGIRIRPAVRSRWLFADICGNGQ